MGQVWSGYAAEVRRRRQPTGWTCPGDASFGPPPPPPPVLQGTSAITPVQRWTPRQPVVLDALLAPTGAPIEGGRSVFTGSPQPRPPRQPPVLDWLGLPVDAGRPSGDAVVTDPRIIRAHRPAAVGWAEPTVVAAPEGPLRGAQAIVRPLVSREVSRLWLDWLAQPVGPPVPAGTAVITSARRRLDSAGPVVGWLVPVVVAAVQPPGGTFAITRDDAAWHRRLARAGLQVVFWSQPAAPAAPATVSAFRPIWRPRRR